jgi:polar amino acid transport system ATP-binding protein
VNAGPVLRLSGIEKSFGAVAALRGVDLNVLPGEVICIIGPSGCGKSTLLRCANFLVEPDQGFVYFEGRPLGHRELKDGIVQRAPERDINAARARIGMVFQTFNLWPHLTALGNVTEAQCTVLGRPPAEARARALRLLEQVGLADKADDYPAYLSGGQQQRVSIARALAMDPRLMLFDEPTSALDPELVAGILAVMRGLADDGMTMMVVTHELGFARQIADRLIFMDRGRIVEQGPPAELLDRPRSDRLRDFLAKVHRV